MAEKGFDPAPGKDTPGVAISREGHILKINRGLHRLAMAQYPGLSSLLVQVRAIHRQWWAEQTRDTPAPQEMARLQSALPACTPEPLGGPLDPAPSPMAFNWPARRLPGGYPKVL